MSVDWEELSDYTANVDFHPTVMYGGISTQCTLILVHYIGLIHRIAPLSLWMLLCTKVHIL